VLAAVVDWLVYRPLRERSGITLLVASMGVAFVLENAVRFVAGNTPLGYAVEAARPWRWAGLRFNLEQLITVAVSLACLLVVALIFKGSRLGRAMRAVADNPSLAATRGVSRQTVATLTWLLAGGLAALAGLLIGLDATLDPQMGWNYLLPVFAAAVLGGWSSPGAAVAGALVMGVLSELSTLVLPAHYRTLVAFAALSLLLLLRPSGLFGRAWVQK
jgi:branched-chain amino acid transport system permease protein